MASRWTRLCWTNGFSLVWNLWYLLEFQRQVITRLGSKTWVVSSLASWALLSRKRWCFFFSKRFSTVNVSSTTDLKFVSKVAFSSLCVPPCCSPNRTAWVRLGALCVAPLIGGTPEKGNATLKPQLGASCHWGKIPRAIVCSAISPPSKVNPLLGVLAAFFVAKSPELIPVGTSWDRARLVRDRSAADKFPQTTAPDVREVEGVSTCAGLRRPWNDSRDGGGAGDKGPSSRERTVAGRWLRLVTNCSEDGRDGALGDQRFSAFADSPLISDWLLLESSKSSSSSSSSISSITTSTEHQQSLFLQDEW